VKGRKREWNDRINRMAEHRTERITRDYYAIGRPSIGCPRKRWKDDAETQNEADEDTDR
jgi:hypothetical protein